MSFNFIFAFLTILLLGCREQKSYLKNSFLIENMAKTTAEARIPSGLWSLIESHYVPLQAFGSSEVQEKNKPLKSRVDIPMKFIPIKVYLVEKSKNILLKSSHYSLIFSDGGGTLDLKDFVLERQGLFTLAIEFPLQELKINHYKIYYLSNAQQKKINNEIYGSGCNVYMDISDYFNEIMNYDGIQLTTLKNQHISLLAGTFVFVAYIDGNLLLSQLTIKDSRFPELQCRNG